MATDYMPGFIDNYSPRYIAANTKPRVRVESELVEAARGGQTEAFDALVNPYTKRLLRSLYRITKNREDAEDALQDALLKAFVHIDSFDGGARFSTWLTRIAINSALMIVRKKRSKAGLAVDADSYSGDFELATIADRALGPEASYAQQERNARVRSAIDALPQTVRHAVELQKMQGHSVGKTAELLGLSIGAVKSRLFRARSALRKSLSTDLFRQPIQEFR